jgi:3-deoxy-manno-octulosonate cytidylyltransferase (CMP-KDO synthetase)
MSVVVILAGYSFTNQPDKTSVENSYIQMIVNVATECLKSKAERVIVVTKQKEILEACEKIEGIEACMSDPNLKSCTHIVSSVCKFLRDDVVINVQGNWPFIRHQLIDQLIDDIAENNNYMSTFCTEIDELSANDENLVKVIFDKNSYAIYFSRGKIPFNRDKKSVRYYKHIEVYGFRREFLLKYVNLNESYLEEAEKLEQLRAIENGYKIKVLLTDYNPIYIDTEESFYRGEKYLKNEQ